jgi:hypothetical protein
LSSSANGAENAKGMRDEHARIFRESLSMHERWVLHRPCGRARGQMQKISADEVIE